MARYNLVSKEKYQQVIAGLPHPTPPQYERFALHLSDAHSWYKHLSLRFGGHFIVFFHPGAGANYPTQHPSLPFGNHTKGYREAFGYLSYMYVSNFRRKRHYSRDDEDTFREGETLVPISKELLPGTSFVLYPYINHNGFETIFNGYSDRQQDMKALQNNEFILPDHELFVTLMQQHQTTEDTYHELSREDTNTYFSIDEAKRAKLIQQKPVLQKFETLSKQVEATYEQLWHNEYQKIVMALKNLRRYLEEG